MKVKLLAILMICSALFLTACSQRSEYEQMQEEYEKNNMTIQQLDEEAQRLMDENGLTQEDIDEYYPEEQSSEESENNQNPTIMRMCSGGDDPHYLVYVTQDSAYKRVNAGGGIITTVTTKYQTCSVAEPSEVPVQCSPLSMGQYNDNYGSAKELTEEPVASMFGLSCSNIEYDPSVFVLE